jgi:hypothetical protein
MAHACNLCRIATVMFATAKKCTASTTDPDEMIVVTSDLILRLIVPFFSSEPIGLLDTRTERSVHNQNRITL